MKTHTHFAALAWRWLAGFALLVAGNAFAQADPPGRVAALTHMEGSVVFAPAGQTEWTEAVRNRPVTRGDRLWTDEGARAELHLGSAALQMDSRTFVDIVALDDDVLQMSLNEGVVNARIRQLEGGENFEIATPHLALRATQPGEFRIDVDPGQGYTRVTVRSGSATVQGAGGGAHQLHAGQSMAFAGRNLAQVQGALRQGADVFDRWAADRNRAEDQSIAARHVPRGVVGYQQLDAHGSWAQDPQYGQVWYPRVTVADWAPYRYGSWEWIDPWGWTWVDDAPWGFAPFHYGRWAEIGSRWAWVPGQLGPRPVYAPALVAFVGGGTSLSLSIGSGPGIGWYPLAPGEIWQPFYVASPVYVRNVNRYVVVDHRHAGRAHHFHHRANAWTTVRVDDFRRGRPVHQHWSRANPRDLDRASVIVPPRVQDSRRWMADRNRPIELRTQPREYNPQPGMFAQPRNDRRDGREDHRDRRDGRDSRWGAERERGDDGDRQRRRGQDDAQRAQREQQQLQMQQQAQQHQQQQQQRHWQDQQRVQREQQQRQANEHGMREHQLRQSQERAQRDQAMRQQQQAQEMQQRQQAWQAQQQQQQQQQQHRERGERGDRGASMGAHRGGPQHVAPAPQQQEDRGGRGQGRRERDERAQGEGRDDDGRARGRWRNN